MPSNTSKYEIVDYGRVLRIKNLVESDSGSYTCVIYVKSKTGNKDYEGQQLPERYPRKEVLTAAGNLSVLGIYLFIFIYLFIYLTFNLN